LDLAAILATFAGAVAYADDLVLIAPTPFAMHTMLHLSERYADD